MQVHCISYFGITKFTYYCLLIQLILYNAASEYLENSWLSLISFWIIKFWNENTGLDWSAAMSLKFHLGLLCGYQMSTQSGLPLLASECISWACLTAKRCWLKYLGPCHSYGKFRLNSWIRSGTYGTWTCLHLECGHTGKQRYPVYHNNCLLQ